MIEMAQHDSDYLNICKYYHAVFNTPAIQEEPAKWQEVRNNWVYQSLGLKANGSDFNCKSKPLLPLLGFKECCSLSYPVTI
jgi:hypothetical protein